MELALRRGASAGVALAAASLIAASPAAQPALDGQLQQQLVQLTGSSLIEVLRGVDDIVGAGTSQIANGLDDLAAGEVPDGLQGILIGIDNAYTLAPQILGVGLIDLLVGQDVVPVASFPIDTLADTISGVLCQIQEDVVTNGLDTVAIGLNDISEGFINTGLNLTVVGVDNIISIAPEDLGLGALNIAWVFFGG